MLTINEIFHSIQGESTYAGRPCVFVRLTACDLRCSWCDTPYAFHEGTKMAVDEVIERVRGYGCDVVEITGGEPLLQKDVYPLMQRLLDEGRTVMLETGGHLSAAQVPAGVVRVIDVKCPGSGEAAKNCWANLDRLRPTDEIKFVIKDRADYEYARRIVSEHDLTRRARPCSSRRCTACWRRSSSPSGSWRTGSPSGSSSRRTSTSGTRRRAGSDACGRCSFSAAGSTRIRPARSPAPTGTSCTR